MNGYIPIIAQDPAYRRWWHEWSPHDERSNNFYCMCKLYSKVSVLINTFIGRLEKAPAAPHGISFLQRTWPSLPVRIIQCPCSIVSCLQHTSQPNMERMCVDGPHGQFSECGTGTLSLLEILFLQTVNKRFLAGKRLQEGSRGFYLDLYTADRSLSALGDLVNQISSFILLDDKCINQFLYKLEMFMWK